MTAQPANFSAFIDAARDSVAREIATLRREAQRERETFAAEMRAARAEWEARLAALSEAERRLADRIATVKDGDPGASVTLADVTPLILSEVGRLVAEFPVPKDGDSVSVDDLKPLIAAEVEAKIAALPPGAPGKDADPTEMQRMVNEAVAALPPAPAGKDADPEQVAALVRETVESALASWERPQDGKSVTLDDVRPMIDGAVREAVAALPPAPAGVGIADVSITNGELEIRLSDGTEKHLGRIVGKDGAPGKLPIAAPYVDRVHYEGEVVSFNGATYQALRDTGKVPGHEDWICIAAAGKPGVDGRSFRLRETWDAKAEYAALDVVVLNGAAFAARRDNPGICPGEGWQMIAAQGKRGNPGEPGRPGKQGEPGGRGAVISEMTVDDDGLLTLKHTDGAEVSVDLYPLLSRLG